MPRTAQAARTWSRLMATTRPPRLISGRSGSSFMGNLLSNVGVDADWVRVAGERTKRPPSDHLRGAFRASEGSDQREDVEFGFGGGIGQTPSDHLPSTF